ncbi:MAG: hypothetical protein E7348_04955 [Clostridiales bacterium]|nr:hypothetical protein [Clostridiales bacterium]
MVTTRRSSEMTNINYESQSDKGGVALKTRPRVETNVQESQVQKQSYAEANERMQKNLDRLLNYDRYTAQQMQIQEEQRKCKNVSDEDFRPTSTTMQFGDDSIEEIREEMNKRQSAVDEIYTINKKGKIAIVLYSLVVAVVMALIVLNTGLLANLNAESQTAYNNYSNAMAEYNQIVSQIEDISSPEHVLNVAQNEYGMIKR